MKRLIVILLGWSIAVGVYAELISFDFRGNGGAFDFGAPTGQITVNGITLDFAAIDPEDATAVLNAAAYFGVNSNDDADTDTVEIGQYITITFSSSMYTSIQLTTIDSGAWSDGDAGYYQISAGPQIALAGNNQSISPSSEVLGATLIYASTAGNGISLNGITVDAVPEPSTVMLLGVGGFAAVAIRRIKRFNHMG